MESSCKDVPAGGVSLLYVTCPDAVVAEALARTLLAERRIACANLLPGMRSFYRWEGELQAADEVVVLLKTISAQVPATMVRIAELHPYQTPCIVELPAVRAAAAFAAWITDQVVAEDRPR